jgi:four helix bundle protein
MYSYIPYRKIAHENLNCSIAKLGIVEEEADEAIYWLEMLAEANIVKPNMISELLAEAHELTAIIAASSKTAKNKS